MGRIDLVNPGQVIDTSDATFEHDVIESSREAPVIVDFWAAWCGPCRSLGPMLEEVVSSSEGVTLAKLDVDHNPAVAMRFGIRGIPAVKAFRDSRVVDEFVGLQPRPAVERFVGRLAAAKPEEVPAGEADLRTALAARPDSLPLRRALGALLIQEGRFDEAGEVLGGAPHDLVCDGLLARAQLLRARTDAWPGDLLKVSAADDLGLVGGVIAAISGADPETKSRLRRVALGVLAAQKNHAAEVEALRRDLASALF